MTVRIDATDRKILAELQRDAGQSLDEIAKHTAENFRQFCAGERLEGANVVVDASVSAASTTT